ncbi:uncharacterized protein LOC124302182 [Neodiprion virginianus]|uniref:uncharacterized protein LOC124302182 n=1 Tax=Neodiprion virginianus TaxID=2961670 RepID=UPI001EE69954|nr:uncharacterized protein LOC124302182 [Neodiprion virginianus]XP_046613991.1 uncharacterized protein LOC124302182 [Neodiprion virginianus]XP_046613992.1 uncharacterized protein LOC124302182 [Neodiprion virginianus]XP_046613994.1 uncharacterized protein LOC124302182 [Neodiprion virginianus]
MSVREQRYSSEIRYETGDDRSTNFDESDSDIKYTSTPLKKIDLVHLRQNISAPLNCDSEESTDVKTSVTRPLPKRRSAQVLKKQGVPRTRRTGIEKQTGKRQIRSKRRRPEESRNDDREKVDERTTTRRSRSTDGNADSESRRRAENLQRQKKAADELPIAELLRNAQENQKNKTRYEEPSPMLELTTDTIYVQGRNGFSAVKIRKSNKVENATERFSKPIHVAIKMHNLSKCVMIWCQGLLGGIALTQILLVAKMEADPSLLALINATNYPQIISGIFLFLVTISLLSAMDRIDFGHFDLDQFCMISYRRCLAIVILLLYLVAICIHLTATDQYKNSTTLDQGTRQIDTIRTVDDEYTVQSNMYTWKYALCIVAWVCIAFGPTDDMTTTHLEALLEYAK